MVYGNLLTTVASFLFAVRWHVEVPLFVATLVGLGLVIASACVCNNILDRKIDAQMERTKKRALVKGAISLRSARVFAVLLGLVGFGVLFVFVNILSGVAAAIGFIFYVVLYTSIKRYSYLGALVGSVSGAMPIVVGYTAATGRFDLVTTLLFIVMACWQMAHFYAISLYRADEYKAAGVPVFAVRHGAHKTRKQVIGFIVATIVAMAVLWVFSELGSVYIFTMLGLTFWWLYKAVTLRPVDAVWGRVLFKASLKVLMGFSFMLILSPLLP
jgi:protoheme IX farnesyltransferase